MSKQPVFEKPHCPHCHYDLTGPLDPSLPDAQHQPSRAIGVEVHGVYDGVLYWQCPVCDGTWQRFDITEPLHREALPYMRKRRQ